jgi:hypothetical protein
MDHEPSEPPWLLDHELVEHPSDAETGVRLVLLRPEAHMRSPMFEQGPDEAPDPDPPPDDDDRPSFDMPPARSLVRPAIWATVPALIALVGLGPFAALIVGALVIGAQVLHLLAGRATFTFADGLLPYKGDDEWPRGVQEENEVHFNWSTARRGHPPPV